MAEKTMNKTFTAVSTPWMVAAATWLPLVCQTKYDKAAVARYAKLMAYLAGSRITTNNKRQ